MAIRLYRAYTPGTRNRSVPKFDEIVKSQPPKKLTYNKHIKKGQNNRGIITSQHRGGGHKRLYRKIDFQRNKKYVTGKIRAIEYDPNRNTYICLINFEDGEKRYILYPRGIKLDDTIISSE
ncbi:hypothetical protein Mapa_009416 [Marchantia paleacea]|nr:hypothetical protein Mapa_009416 [Marchantia paleacea]